MWGGEVVLFSRPITIRLLPLARRCFHCLYLALLSMLLSILGPIWISVISLPVDCFASAMYSVLSFRGPVLVSCDAGRGVDQERSRATSSLCGFSRIALSTSQRPDPTCNLPKIKQNTSKAVGNARPSAPHTPQLRSPHPQRSLATKHTPPPPGQSSSSSLKAAPRSAPHHVR